MFTIDTGIVRFLALACVDVLSQNRTMIVGESYGNHRVFTHFNWKSCGARAMSVRSPYDFWAIAVSLRSPYDCLSPNYHKKSCGDRTIIAGSPYGAHTTCLRTRSYDFYRKKCESANFCKIVESTKIVGSRRIVGTLYGHHVETKMQKKKKKKKKKNYIQTIVGQR